nr:MAG TPA: replisome organizer [Caudoviricetes sp.]
MRIRTIRPEFYQSESVGSMTWKTRLVFINLWSYVEDNGVNLDNPRLFRGQCMPYDDSVLDDIEDAFAELEQCGGIIRYERDGKRLLFVPGFVKWQNITRPGTCHYLPPDGWDKRGCKIIHEDSRQLHEHSCESHEDSRQLHDCSRSRSSSKSRKKEEENKFSSSKEITADCYHDSIEYAATDRTIASEYANLDLTDAWLAFTDRHQGETRIVNDWTRLWKGWCQRRANMSGIPHSKRHIHTWQCEHVLQALGRDKETATPDQQACQMAKQLNKEENAK